MNEMDPEFNNIEVESGDGCCQYNIFEFPNAI